MSAAIHLPGIGGEFGLSQRGGYHLQPPSPLSWTCLESTLASSGRAALSMGAAFLMRPGLAERDTVLLPAYLCYSMIQPFSELGLQVQFYAVGPGLSVQPDPISERVDGRTLAVLVMHYFGFRQPHDLIGILSDQFPHIGLIDDRTHLLLSDLNGVTAPDDRALAVYSPRKWGPFPDLGILLWPSCVPDAARKTAPTGHDWPFALWRLLGALLRALFLWLPLEVLRRCSLKPFHWADAVLDARIKTGRASAVSRFLWARWRWSVAWRVRRENFQYLLDNWSAPGVEPIHRVLPESVCPLGFPVRSAGRDSLRQHLIDHGVFPPIHWLRPCQVSPVEFPEAAALAEQELTIPVDQRYGRLHMDHVLDTISRFR